MMVDDDNAGAAEIIARCWQGGLGIGETIKAVSRGLGSQLTFEQVRRCFAELAAGLADRGDPA